eukprot:3941737-Rhodomonas_salina.2
MEPEARRRTVIWYRDTREVSTRLRVGQYYRVSTGDAQDSTQSVPSEAARYSTGHLVASS